jgi:hypothetical protein
VGQFHEDVPPTHFWKVLMALGIGMLPLLDTFRPYLGPVLGNMIVKTTTGYQCQMNIKEVSGKSTLEAGWSDFAVTHNLKIGYMLLFKKLSGREYIVVLFDYSCCEVVGRCPQHPDYMKRSDEGDEWSMLSLVCCCPYRYSMNIIIFCPYRWFV